MKLIIMFAFITHDLLFMIIHIRTVTIFELPNTGIWDKRTGKLKTRQKNEESYVITNTFRIVEYFCILGNIY